MKYDAAKEKEQLNERYRDHELYPALSILIYWFIASVKYYLAAADELVFQGHSDATVTNVRRLLKKALLIESVDESMKLRGKIATEEAKPWMWHSEFSSLWKRFSEISRFIHGEWSSLTSGVYGVEGRYVDGVFVRDRFYVPEEKRAEFVAISHELTRSHVREVVERLGASKCIKDWEFYDPELETLKLQQQYHFTNDELLSRFVSNLTKEIMRVLTQSEALFNYRRTPEFYLLLMSFLDLSGCEDGEQFKLAFKELCSKNKFSHHSPRALEIRGSLGLLRGVVLNQKDEAFLAMIPLERQHSFPKQNSDILMAHLADITDRLKKEQKIVLNRRAQLLCSRCEKWVGSVTTAEKLRKKLDDFFQNLDEGQYDFHSAYTKPLVIQQGLFNLSLAEGSVSPVEQMEEAPLKKLRLK